MLRWALIFLVIAVMAALFGFVLLTGSAAALAKVLFGLASVAFAIFLAVGWATSRKLAVKL